MIEQTRAMMQKMKFFGMMDTLDLRLHEARSNSWSHGDFISALITDEKISRDDRATKTRIRVAKFRTEATLEKLDLTSKRTISKDQVQQLKSLKFLTEPRNVLILGPTGVGKTFLATAIGDQACRDGYRVLFMGMNMFIEETTISRAAGNYLRLRDRLVRVDLLILDDLGIKPLPTSAIQDLYDILEERYQNKATMITSQLPLENWKEVIDDAVSLEAIMDRLIHGVIKVEIKGESYRKKRETKK
ncbi:MAG: ATP-binding protein [Oligoflexia bacterium]|nr:ATP-binding protein [Oligoflexia bacterium]